ncbi:hypothetical protein BCR44DRAFT_33654 [Catenaria anguillulae PL171]|nr:hypothetical protein BCR44DRAFT_33654 [Catenaria anguillulae PL171]
MALVGSDAGHVVHLDARRIRPLADSAPGVPADSLNASATLTNPHFKYASHAGAVNAIVANPHLPSLFATLGQDGKVLIHRLFKDMPLLRIQPAALSSSSPNPTPLLSGAWSPSRPGLLAVTSTDTLYLISICGSDPGTVVAQLSLPCTGPLLFHPTLPLLYVGVIENGASGMRVVRLAASALKLGDMEVRVKEMTELGRMIGGDNNDE